MSREDPGLEITTEPELLGVVGGGVEGVPKSLEILRCKGRVSQVQTKG